MNKPLHETYPGRSRNRLHPEASNPREVAFAEAWMRANAATTCGSTPLLVALTAPMDSRGQPSRSYVPSPAEQATAATIIQWLGSNVGMAFLMEVVARSPEVRDFVVKALPLENEDALVRPSDYDVLVPLCHVHLLALAGSAMQPKLRVEDAEPLAEKHARLLSFFGVEPRVLRTTSLLYQSLIDYHLSRLHNLNDATLLRFFSHIGRALTSEEFTAWFFSR